jgi:hypothetical protein
MQQSVRPPVAGYCCVGGIVYSDSALIMSCAGQICKSPKVLVVVEEVPYLIVQTSEFSIHVHLNPTMKKTTMVACWMK